MSRIQILVVEDDQYWREEIFKEILTEEGYDVVPASTLADALDELTKHDFALAVVDICLSEKNPANADGLEVLKTLARRSPPVPSLVVSAWLTVPLSRHLTRQFGAKDFIEKVPWNEDEFRQLVRQYLTPPTQEYFVGHGFSDAQKKDLRPAVERALASTGLKPYRADDVVTPKAILQKIMEKISLTQFCIFDISLPRPNVFIEIGVAIGLNRPLLILAQRETIVPQALKSLVSISYSSYAQLTRDLAGKTDALARRIEKGKQLGTNYCHICEKPCVDTVVRQERRYLVASPRGQAASDFNSAVEGALREHDYHPLYLDEEAGGGMAVCQFCHLLRSTAFGIYHLHTETPCETFLALGLAIGLKAAFVLLSPKDSDLPSNLKGWDHFEYTAYADIEAKLAESIQDLLTSAVPPEPAQLPGTQPNRPPIVDGLAEARFVRILHISDIHRGADAPTSNTALLGNLLDDIESAYAEDNSQLGSDEPWLGPPDLVLVSGDLTQHGSADEFDLAQAFLEDLVPLVGGDRQRIILVPGNHDVNWSLAAQSYRPATQEEFETQPQYTAPYHQSVKRARDGTYWHKDEATYTTRFQPFKAFFDAFYEHRLEYSLARDSMFTVYDLTEQFGLVIVGFNSCDEIDAYPLGDQARSLDRRAFVHTDAMYRAKNTTDFHAKQADLLRVAVFHHNIRSVDFAEDFMDPKGLQILKRHRYDLCLHGHVHTAGHDVFDPASTRQLPVVGAGSLAEPYSARPPAAPMGYNLIVFDRQSGGIWVHTRRHDEDNLVWAADYRWQGKPYFQVRAPKSVR